MMTPEKLGIYILVAFILVAAICRINMLDVRKHRYSFALVYLLLALFAGGTLADYLTTDQTPSLWSICGLLAAAVNIWLTRDRWPNDVPWIAVRKEYRQERRTTQQSEA